MRSSSGQYFEKLDHVRALAAFMVFSWHFTHMAYPVLAAPVVPVLSIFEEGYTGVSLFMVLSGYLFAKLLRGRDVVLHRFFWNRAVRLLPLLLLVLALNAAAWLAEGDSVQDVLYVLVAGTVLPVWPKGTWSIAVELHFYVVLPIVLVAVRRNMGWALGAIAIAVAFRLGIHQQTGGVQGAAYWTIIGRFDQFLAGVCAQQLFRDRSVPLSLVLGGALGFTAFWHWYNLAGGYYGTSRSVVWAYLPTVEAVFYALMIAGYDRAKWSLPQPLSRSVASVGTVSFSMYLLHIYYYSAAADFLGITDRPAPFLVLLTWSLVAFVAFVPVCWLFYRTIEVPFLRMRVEYDRTRTSKDESLWRPPELPAAGK